MTKQSMKLPLLVAVCIIFPQLAQSSPLPLGHDRTRPLPPVVDPGLASTPERAGQAPSDAVVLFDGKDLSAWAAMNGTPTEWIIKEAAMECVPGSGYIRTLQNFGECQLHIEFATPAKAEGSSQGRGNSGVFFGNTRYEIQVLDSYKNKTYADGSCGSIYNQYPPLVNACRPPGEWQTYDIIWTPPRFNSDNSLLSPARVTAFQNGVLIQNNVELFGETGWLERKPFAPHPEKQFIALQDHGNPVRYRNIWVRELGAPGRPEFQLSDALLDSYCGTYKQGENVVAEVSRQGGNLVIEYRGVDFVMYAGSPTHFFAKTVDVQADFEFGGSQETVQISVGEDGGSKASKAQ